MSKQPHNKFFIGLQKKNGTLVGYRTAADPGEVSKTLPPEPPSGSVATPPQSVSADFRDVFISFVGIMESYRKFIPMTLRFAPFMSSAMADQYLGDFANS